jgi:type IV secretory pathway component VirB8
VRTGRRTIFTAAAVLAVAVLFPLLVPDPYYIELGVQIGFIWSWPSA